MNWKPITGAPRDGRPIWARGWNFGKQDKGSHYGWVYFDEAEQNWMWAGGESLATHLTDYLENAGAPA